MSGAGLWSSALGADGLTRNHQFLTTFNVSVLCYEIAHAGQVAPLPMVVRSLVFPRDARGRYLIQQESSVIT